MIMTIKMTLGRHNYSLKKAYGGEFNYIMAEPPALRNGTLYLPLREIIEGFGGEERWDGHSMTARPILGNRIGRVTIGFTYGAYITEKGRIMVTADYFKRSHSIKVDFEQETGNIVLTKEYLAVTGASIPDKTPEPIDIDNNRIITRFFISSDCQGNDLGYYLNTDDGVSPNMMKVLMKMKTVSPAPDFIVVAGDLVSGPYTDIFFHNGMDKIEVMKDMIKNFRGRFNDDTFPIEKIFPGIGNHETRGHIEFEETFTSMFPEFYTRNDVVFCDASENEYKKTVWYYDIGNARLYYLNNVHSKEEQSVDGYQLEWLKESIARAPHITRNFFVMHEVPFSTWRYGWCMDGKKPAKRNKLWQVIESAANPMVFVGHEHVYTRKRINSAFNEIVEGESIWFKKQIDQLHIAGFGNCGSSSVGSYKNVFINPGALSGPFFAVVDILDDDSVHVKVINLNDEVLDEFLSTSSEINYIAVEKIEIDKRDAALEVGESLQLYARVLPSDAENHSLIWASSNPNIASVDRQGLLTAKGTGTVSVAATAPNILGDYKIKAVNVTVRGYSKEPRALVTTFSGDPKTERAFTWYTSTEAEKAVLEYTTQGFDNWNSVQGTTKLFNTKCPCGTDHGLRHIHKVRLQGLLPGMVYSYRVGDGAVWSEIETFETESADTRPFTFLWLTDPQGSAERHYAAYGKTMNAGIQKFPESRFILMSGDAVEEGNREDWWDWYFDYAKPFIRRLPLMTVVGNHDTRGGGVINFNHHFYYPDNGCGLSAGLTIDETSQENILEMDNTIYSFDYGDVHFSCINTGSSRDGKTNPAGFLEVQREWLRDDIRKSDKKWKIIMLHRPLYGSKDDNPDVRRVFAGLLSEIDVDIVLQGHDHVYVRTFPMRNDIPQKDGKSPVYVINGASGRKFYNYQSQPWTDIGGTMAEQTFAGIQAEDNCIMFHVYTSSGILIDSFKVEK